MHHFTYKDGVLHAENIPVPDIAAAVGTPFYCYSTATLERHYRVFADAFDSLNPLICYAIKANSNLAVIATLARLGAGADVVSEGELRRALAAGVPADLASLDDMKARAARLWDGGQPYFVRVWHPGDANSIVEMRRSFTDSVTMNLDSVYFDGPSGDILLTHQAKPVMSVQRFLAGIHFIQFEHWTLRWLYFALGLAGCVMIATGFIHWLAARRKRHAAQGLPGVRIVEGLTIGAVTGIVVATLAFFVANRLLPASASLLGHERDALEVWIFYLVWLASFSHGWTRPGHAWREQCWSIAGLAPLAVVLNAVTTGDHLGRTLTEGAWAIAGMDLMLLAGAAIAAASAWRLQKHRPTMTGPSARRTLEAAE